MSPFRRVLEGGIASDVAIVKEGGREIVIKEALPRLKVTADWCSDPSRSSLEAEALRAAAELLGSDAVPEVLWIDADNHRFAMERIDPELKNWRSELTASHVDLETAARAGELLAHLHVRSAQRADLATRFGNRGFFEELRIRPFFRRSAERNPEVRDEIEYLVERLRAPGTALVHGDFSPKNMLACGRRVVVLDWEVAHWGDPRFDLAFCLSHLLLGGWRFSTSVDQFREAVLTFAESYFRHGSAANEDAHLIALLGALVLARLDGDSPVDYLEDLDVPHVRRMAVRTLKEPATGLVALVERLLS